LEFSTAKTAFAETKAWLHRRQHRGWARVIWHAKICHNLIDHVLVVYFGCNCCYKSGIQEAARYLFIEGRIERLKVIFPRTRQFIRTDWLQIPQFHLLGQSRQLLHDQRGEAVHSWLVLAHCACKRAWKQFSWNFCRLRKWRRKLVNFSN
jgi:hypothetical protein